MERCSGTDDRPEDKKMASFLIESHHTFRPVHTNLNVAAVEPHGASDVRAHGQVDALVDVCEGEVADVAVTGRPIGENGTSPGSDGDEVGMGEHRA